MDVYDLRAQERTEELHGISADGATLSARASLVTYHLPASELPRLVREIGPEYYRFIVAPIVRSTARRVLARLRADELGTANLRAAQDEITRLASERLRSHHIILDSIVLRGVFALAPRAYAKVIETAELEQQAQAEPDRRALARSKAERAVSDALGIAAAHGAVAPTLTRGVLNDLERRAWSQVLASPSTTVELNSTEEPLQAEISP